MNSNSKYFSNVLTANRALDKMPTANSSDITANAEKKKKKETG